MKIRWSKETSLNALELDTGFSGGLNKCRYADDLCLYRGYRI